MWQIKVSLSVRVVLAGECQVWWFKFKGDVEYKIGPDGNAWGSLVKGGESVKFSCLPVTDLATCKRECWEGRQGQGTHGLTESEVLFGAPPLNLAIEGC